MSYILDALRKADRDRQVARVPTLATTHASTISLRRPVWTWVIAAAVLAVTAGVIYAVVWVPGRSGPVRKAEAPRAVTPPAPGRSAEPAPAGPPPRVTRPQNETAMAPAPGAAAAPQAGAVEPARPPVAPVAPLPSPSQAARAGSDRPAGTSDAPEVGRAPLRQAVPAPLAAPRDPGAVPEPHAGASAAAPPTVAPAPFGSPEAGRVAARQMPAAPPASARGADATVESDDEDDEAPPAPPPAVRTAPAPSPEAGRTAGDRAPRVPRAAARRPAVIPGLPVARLDSPSSAPRVEGDAVPPPAAATAPFGTPEARASAAPAPASAPPLTRFTLDVLVYSDVPAERLVFINGRKYVEGQTLDADTVVEQITPDGAIVRYQGTQWVLRPKLNPYTRPGSP